MLAEAFGTMPDNAGPFEIDAWLEKEATLLRAGNAVPEKPDCLLIAPRCFAETGPSLASGVTQITYRWPKLRYVRT